MSSFSSVTDTSVLPQHTLKWEKNLKSSLLYTACVFFSQMLHAGRWQGREQTSQNEDWLDRQRNPPSRREEKTHSGMDQGGQEALE